nr:hypothetical protein [Tanacetum cinerariifolium]
MAECLALADLGASINIMPFFVWKRLSLPNLTPTCMTLELAYRSISRPVRVAEDVYVKVGSFHFPADFVVIDFNADPRVPLVLERSFLKTERALIDVFEGELTLHVFNLDQTSRYSANYSNMTETRIDVIDMACEDDFLLEEVNAFLANEDDPTSLEFYQPYLDPEGDILLLEAFLNDDPSLPPLNQGNYLPEEVELKDLPPHLEYAFLEGDDKLPVIIAKDLSVEEKTALITFLKSHKRAITWKLFDIKGIDPEFSTHKILMKEDFEPAAQHQRRVNPKIYDVIKQEGRPAKTPLKVLRLLFLGASSCPEESSKSKEALHELRASLCTCLTNGMILPLQALLLRSREKLKKEQLLEVCPCHRDQPGITTLGLLVGFPPSQSITLKLIYSQSCLKSIFTTHHIEDLLHVRDPNLRINGSYHLLKGMRLLLVKAFNPFNQQMSAVTTAMTAILKQFQATPPPAFVKADLAEYTIKVPPPPIQKYKPPSQRDFVMHQKDPLHPNIPYPSRMLKQKQQEKDEVQIHKFWQMFKQLYINITLADALILMPKYRKMLKALLSNKEKLQELANTPFNENCSAVILKKLPEKLGDLGKFLIPCLPELISTRMTLELANRAICTPAGIARDVFIPVGKFTFPTDFVIVDYENDPIVPLILGRPFLRTARALIDVHGEKMILRDSDERLTLNMRHDTSSYSNQPQKESINLINVFNNLNEDFLKNLFLINQQSGNPTFFSHLELTSSKVKDIFDPEGGNVLPEKLLDLDSTEDLHPPLHVNPLSGSTTSFHSPSHLLEEFANELALITFPLEYDDDLQFDIESDLKEIEYLLHHDPIKDIDSSLKDSIDQSNLADLNDNFVYSMLEMFTNEHALDYSSPPLFDEYDDDLFEVESDTKNVYDDPFDST